MKLATAKKSFLFALAVITALPQASMAQRTPAQTYQVSSEVSSDTITKSVVLLMTSQYLLPSEVNFLAEGIASSMASNDSFINGLTLQNTSALKSNVAKLRLQVQKQLNSGKLVPQAILKDRMSILEQALVGKLGELNSSNTTRYMAIGFGLGVVLGVVSGVNASKGVSSGNFPGLGLLAGATSGMFVGIFASSVGLGIGYGLGKITGSDSQAVKEILD